jgi:citrate lyase subunit beta / citryl-CoA lyase
MTGWPNILFLADADGAIPEDTPAMILPAGHTLSSAAMRFALVEAEGGIDAVRAAVATAPHGIALAHCTCGADVQRLDVLLSVAEAEAGFLPGKLPVIALTNGLLPPPRSEQGFARKSGRLKALVWDWRGLARLLGARRTQGEDGRWTDAFAQAQSAVLLSAKVAGIRAYDSFDAPSPAVLEAKCRESRLDGFDGAMIRQSGDLAAARRGFGEG